MNREIKFRIFVGGRFHYWGFINATFVGLPSVNSEPLSYTEIMLRSEQYIGLKDKNGKEMYEGDLLSVEGDIHQIVWCGDDDYPAFDLKPHLNVDSNGLSFLFCTATRCEVIGNIHETPELLS